MGGSYVRCHVQGRSDRVVEQESEGMTIALFDLTEHTQMSIRGTTGTHPDSKYVFGIHIGTDEVHAEQLGLTPDITAYDDMDWSKAVELVMSKS